MCATRATLLGDLGEHQEALAVWDRVLSIGETQGPELTSFNCRAFRALTLAYLADYEQATKAIEAAIGVEEKEASPLYIAGEVYAMSAALVHNDTKRSAEEQTSLSEQYGARAVEFLRRAQAAGFFKTPSHRDQFKNNKNFASLQSRPDFQKFLRDLESLP
jgi:tetratricopeptide (TPR) repeat protein